MSAISGSSTSASLLYLAIQSSASGACDNSNMGSTAGTGDAGAAQTTQSGSGSQTSPLGDLRSQIETAVTNSLSQLPAGSSPEDIFKAVQSAVQDTLKANGIEPSQIGGHHGGHHHHQAGGAGGAGNASSASSGTSSTSDPDGDGDGNSQTTDPLLAALEATAGTANTTQSATGTTDTTDTTDTGVSGQTTQPANNLLALFATGPNASDAISTLVQQLTGGGSQNGQTGGQSQTTSPLLSALQNNSSGTLSLTDIFQQLFQNFPNGTGLDVQV
jgi:hypothetical protein